MVLIEWPATGWAPAGSQAVITRRYRGPKVSIIGAVRRAGPRALAYVDGGVNGAEFLRWVLEDLGPGLSPGDIVVMDGLSVHRMKAVRDALAIFGASPLYLPAYSPELNLIEHVWSMVKSAVNALGLSSMDAMKEAFTAAWDALSATVCTTRTVATVAST